MSYNLANKSQAERDAIERDKQRWIKARHLFYTWNHEALRQWLQQLEKDDREDWRRRLNAVRLRHQQKRGHG